MEMFCDSGNLLSLVDTSMSI